MQPSVVSAQVVFGFELFQLEFRGVGGAVQQLAEPVAAIFFDELVRVLGALIAQYADLDGGVGEQRQAAVGGFLARLIGVVAEHHLIGVLAEQLDLVRRQGGTKGTDRRVKAGLVH